MESIKTMLFGCPFALVMAILPSIVMADSDRLKLGGIEKVYIQELDITYQAKIDTGAESASLNGVNIKIEGDEDDNNRKVTFDLVLPNGKFHKVTMPLYDTVRIKKRADDVDDDDKSYTERASLELTLCIGKSVKKLEVNLADRRRFSTDMLVGSKGIVEFNAVVDPEHDFQQGEPDCQANQTAGE